jgi:hypothetical protein
MRVIRFLASHNFNIFKYSILFTAAGFAALFLAGCASMHEKDQTEIFMKSKSYRSHSFDEVWSAALQSIEEIEFIVRKASKEIGFIHALSKVNPEPSYLPPHMNVIIRVENGRIDVNFHIELPGQRDEAGKRKSYADQFFKALNRNLD